MSNKVLGRGCGLDVSEDSLVLWVLATWDRGRAVELKAQEQISKSVALVPEKKGLHQNHYPSIPPSQPPGESHHDMSNVHRAA